MCNTIKNYFKTTFTQMINEFIKIINKPENNLDIKENIFLLHGIMIIFVSCSEIDNFGP